MNKVFIAVFLSYTFFSCSVKQDPLHYGEDGCHACKMTLMDKKFGAEIVTKKGKVYKFDDVNCMIGFYNSGYEPVENIAMHLIIDFAHPEKLIDAQHAYYVKSDQVRSPMASSIAAFESKQEMDQHNTEWNGIVLSWGELVTQFK
jgi:copper chaperone NosL